MDRWDREGRKKRQEDRKYYIKLKKMKNKKENKILEKETYGTRHDAFC